MDPVQAWREGVNVQAAYNNPQTQAAVEATLIAMVAKTLRYLDYSRTITADQDIIDAVEHLRLEFPAMKLEEWAIIFHRLKTGQYRPGYERLKLPELVSIFQQYEGERAERREENWGELKKHTPNNLNDEQVQALYAKYAQQRREAIEAAKKETEVKHVPTDERGRWNFIPYPNTKDNEPEGGDGQKG
jgi:hypothetical protein|tara:strand:- start:367 stop:930 length:564 start_codon:yes stop_codon:yes gene_type:complete